MKIIEAMKEIKDLQRRNSDLIKKIKDHCADLDFENPVYEDQAQQVRGWIQSVHDSTKRILALRVAIQRTNLATLVTVEVGGRAVERTISEWIYRRRDLSQIELESWSALTDRNLKDGYMKQSQGEPREVKVRRYYDPKERDAKKEEYMSEPNRIDARLEVVNAVTDLVVDL